MIPISKPNFRKVHSSVMDTFLTESKLVSPSTWQGRDVSAKPEMATHELEDVVLEFPVGTEDLDYHRHQIGPNLPWADRHFELDRVSGHPRNPGLTWAEWPYALKADGFRSINGQFNHTYAERYWPKYAYESPEGIVDDDVKDIAKAKFGIRYPYGDLSDLVDLLVKTPSTRGAYLPVIFPEDTGIVHGGRTPCTIGYLFRLREGKLNVAYDIRSCDLVRHFKDDVYLTVRLLLWVIDRCRERDSRGFWSEVRPGRFFMHVGSFHVFENDWRTHFG